MAPHQSSVRNLILASLSPDAFARLTPRLSLVRLESRQEIEAPRTSIGHVYFYETCVASTIVRVGSEEVEAQIVGREGASGMAFLHDAVYPSLSSFIQIPGEAWRIPAADLRASFADVPGLNALMLRAIQAGFVQVACTALANARFTILERMARWLLMCHDRVPGDEIELTHSFLSIMLGVRRAGITTDMHVLEGARAVINRRGRIIVNDRARLEQFAGPCYGVPESEYEHLLGCRLSRSTPSRPLRP
jgi:CRP-like cAMP-binding protein